MLVASDSTEKEKKGVAYMLVIEIQWEVDSGWVCADEAFVISVTSAVGPIS